MKNERVLTILFYSFNVIIGLKEKSEGTNSCGEKEFEMQAKLGFSTGRWEVKGNCL